MVRFLVALVLLLLTPGLASAFWACALAFAASSALWVPFALGTLAGLLLDHFVLRRLSGFEVFEHELTHALASLLFFRSVKRFVVTRHRGGFVQHTGGFGGRIGDDFIGLAPYVLPTFTALSILLRPVIPATWFPWYDGWVGLTFGYHAWSSARETALGWTRRATPAADGTLTKSDLGSRGLLFSGIYILAVGLALHGVLLAILVGGYGGVPPWGREVGAQTVRTVNALVGLFQGR